MGEVLMHPIDGVEAGSNVKSVNGKTGAVTLEKGDVGLGSVANLDQSKAIKSITRSGTTFTATALDGTTTTFTQQDSNTTYGVATSSADGLMSASDKSKLDGIGAGSNVKSVNGKTGAVTLSKADVGLGNVDNTKDADKPISTAVQTALDAKANNSVATESTDGLMSAADKSKLDGIASTYATKSELSSHSQNTSNPHKVTASQVGALPLSGGSLTGNLTAPSFQTGTGNANYFQCRKFRGEGNANNYYHAVDFGYAGHNQVDFYEYGGKYVFHRHQDSDAIIGEINGNGFVGKVNGHTINADVPVGAKFTDTTYSVATSSTDGLMSAADKTKLDGIGAESNVKSVNGKTGAVSLSKADVGLGNVDNTSDADKPISTAVQTALDKKADKTIATTSANGLMSAADKTKLAEIESKVENILTSTLFASGWTGTEAPYQYDLSTITSFKICTIGFDSSTGSEEQLKAAQSANIHGGIGTSIYAYGTKPDTNIPIVIEQSNFGSTTGIVASFSGGGGGFSKADSLYINTFSNTVANGHLAEVAEALKSGTITTDNLVWAVGDTASISHNGTTYTWVIQNKESTNATGIKFTDGTAIHYVIGMKNCESATRAMNSSNKTSGSWNGSAMRAYCNGTFRDNLPTDVKNAFKQFMCVTAQTYSGSTNQTSSDYFALPAAKEIFGGSASSAGSGTSHSNLTEFNALKQFEWYKTSANRIKKLGDSGSADCWWERSPHYRYDTSFCYVDSDGSASFYGAMNDSGVSPFGCI